MIDPEIKQYIDERVEKAMLSLPEIIGNLMQQTVANHKLTSKFYKEYPEFANYKDLVAAVIEQTEGNNPLKKYEEILKEAIPSIREKIKTKGHLNLDKVNFNPNRDFNGEI